MHKHWNGVTVRLMPPVLAVALVVIVVSLTSLARMHDRAVERAATNKAEGIAIAVVALLGHESAAAQSAHWLRQAQGSGLADADLSVYPLDEAGSTNELRAGDVYRRTLHERLARAADGVVAGIEERESQRVAHHTRRFRSATASGQAGPPRDLVIDVGVPVNDATGAALRTEMVAVAATILLGVLMICVSTYLLLRHRIIRPLNEAITSIERVRDGDLTIRCDFNRDDEVGQLLGAMCSMVERMRTLLAQIGESAVSIQNASVEIAAGNQDLSNRTESTAFDLQRAATSMEQVTTMVRQTAEAAMTASQLATAASTVATRGGEAVADVVRTMDEIDGSSRKIADIIGMIDSIAFQTNILALNAAVEAARAGDQGRGFVVVATEVRSLAHRSASAAQEIKELIQSSVNRVDAGSRLVREAGRTMDEIVASVAQVHELIAEITAASRDQSNTISEVSASVLRIDGMTQQNTALVEESAAAAALMQEQSAQFTRILRTFIVDPTPAATTARET